MVNRIKQRVAGFLGVLIPSSVSSFEPKARLCSLFKPRLLIILTVLSCFLIAGPVMAAGSLDPYEGTLVRPEISLDDPDHRGHQLVDYRGKVVLVNFWASWCLPCVKEMPGMQRLADRLSDQPFEILAVNISDSERRAREFSKRMNLDLTILMDPDGEVLKAWQVQVLPTSFLLDQTGLVCYQVVGPIDWDDPEVLELVEGLIQSR